MALAVFDVLTMLTAVSVAWGAVALALRQSRQPTVQQGDGAGDGTGARAHMRVW